MKFVAIDCAQQYGSTYVGGEYTIRHTEGGFGHSIARVHKGERVVKEFAGDHSLAEAMAYCRARAHTEAA